MKIFKQLAGIALTTLALISCNNDDDTNEINQVSESKVDVYIQFEHTFGAKEEFELNKDYQSENNGTLNISTLKYLVTDFKLHGAEGTEDFSVAAEENFHIVDAACAASLKKYFVNVPDGKYNKITFRYGVSETVQNAGIGVQGELLEVAKQAGMNWGWTLGYRFLTYEGTSNDVSFKVHNGSTGAIVATKTTSIKNDGGGHHSHAGGERIDNSQEITIDLKGDIAVKNETSPKIHLKVDVAKILTSTHVLDISQEDIIIDTHKSSKVAENTSTMFVLEHIHPTDTNFDLPDLEACNSSSNPNEDTDHDHNSHEHGDKEEAEHDDKNDGEETHVHSKEEVTDEHSHDKEMKEEEHSHNVENKEESHKEEQEEKKEAVAEGHDHNSHEH